MDSLRPLWIVYVLEFLSNKQISVVVKMEQPVLWLPESQTWSYIPYHVELLLELLVGVVDAELLEAVDLERLEAVDVEHADEQLVRLA